MSAVILQSNDRVHVDAASGFNRRSLVQRLKDLARGYGRKPGWAHVPDRAWRRNSALLTYLREAQTGEQ